MIMKRLKMFCTLLSVVVLLSACGNENQKSTLETIIDESVSVDTENSSDESASVGTENSSDESVEQANTPIVYDYEQELNIIDDNFRNYYEIFVYSFCDSNGDGIGDLNGVINKLDYIKDMGFNGIWLMPIMPSTTYHKYDVTDYMDIDAQYGSLEDFDRLVDECHNRDIKLIIDVVINHTSSKHEWFVKACDYLKTLPKDDEPDLNECPYVDYYHFSREKLNGDYYSVAGTDWYYEGVFWSEMPDLNLASDTLRTELEDISSFWVDKGVDGFRMDAAIHYEENDNNFNIEVMNWIYEYCKNINPDFYMVAEVWSSKATISNYYASEIPSIFNFDTADAEGKIIKAARGNYKAASLVESMKGYQQEFGDVFGEYIDAPFITNHDQNRVANGLMKDENDLKMACGLLMTMNGSPFVYYGEEIGMCSSGKKDENKRLPMFWSENDSDEMTNGPADADKDIVQPFESVEKQLCDDYSILNYYKRALRIRNENPEIARGEIEIVESLTDGYIAAITKTYEESMIAIVYNTSDEECSVDIAQTELEDMTIRGYLTLNGEIISIEENKLKMPAQSICILK